MNTWVNSFVLFTVGDIFLKNFSLNPNLIVASIFQLYTTIEINSLNMTNVDFSDSVYGFFLYDLCSNLLFEEEEKYRKLNFFYIASCFLIDNVGEIPKELTYILTLASYSIKHC